ncbi:myocyte-specific enhancer factor 2D isoform 6-T7 [Clarias gariepinus]|uniref:myocyte-specific enhancer factor 2D isoform X5 n=1 Tax=Clarias gariepinus TaxID=13013 RepID=UPI00234DB369|nr:myocyte-specific enhancer factor 2D isoform X5 [Clarias gariepinus]
MGRKKIQIQRITDERNRQVTFTKRKFGLMKKAYELSVLCDCEIALIIFNHSNKLFQYASTDMDKVLLKYTEYNEPHESRTNADIIEALNKKEHRDSESPDPEEPFSLTPRTEEKYKKIDEEFDKMMQSYRLSSTVPAPTFSMPVTVPVSSQSPLPFSNPSSLVTTSFVTSTLTDPRLLSPQQPQLQRNTVSPGLPQRPASAGALLGGDLNNSNGACPSPVANGYISARASPGLLSVSTVSNGNSMGKVVPAKSPPPSSPQMVSSRKPDLRVITSQSSKSLMQLTDEELELVTENAQRLGASQPLTTPVVSVATPSLLTPFSMPTAYNTEYQLTSADLTALQAFTPQGALLPSNMTAWQQQQPSVSQQPQQQPSISQPQQQQQQPQQISLASLSNLVPVGPIPHGATLTVNTNPGVSIKSEPVSPNRERSTPISTAGLSVSQYPGAVRVEASGRSPLHTISSSSNSSERDETGQPRPPEFSAATLGPIRIAGGQTSSAESQEGANGKRIRLDNWNT